MSSHRTAKGALKWSPYIIPYPPLQKLCLVVEEVMRNSRNNGTILGRGRGKGRGDVHYDYLYHIIVTILLDHNGDYNDMINII